MDIRKHALVEQGKGGSEEVCAKDNPIGIDDIRPDPAKTFNKF